MAICYTSLIFLSKLSNAIGANNVTCRVLEWMPCASASKQVFRLVECNVHLVTCIMFTLEHWYLAVIRSTLYCTFSLHSMFKRHYLMRCDKNNRLGRWDMLTISALDNLMLPRGATSCYLEQTYSTVIARPVIRLRNSHALFDLKNVWCWVTLFSLCMVSDISVAVWNCIPYNSEIDIFKPKC